jgi:hypothetical protein
VADYQAILAGVQYVDTKTGRRDDTDRTITVVVNDGTQDSEVCTVTVHVAAPAGAAGDPINLALSDPSPDHLGFITATISGLPSGWSLSEGSHNSDGTWTVQTNHIAELTVTSPDDYAGALVLDVAMTWTNPDGTIESTTIPDNVEVYPKASPIFAWSGDDSLTASSAHDLLVFSQPIGDDTVYSFDVLVDQIDLIGFAGFSGFADIQSHLSEDAAGNAVITLSDGQSITLSGIDADMLGTSNFVFDQEPVITNTGAMTIADGAVLPLSGVLDNSGTINLNSTGDQTDLQLVQTGLTLDGGGQIILSDNDSNVIAGTGPGVILDNLNNTISGAGQLGGGELTLINGGTINATGTHSLTIDTDLNTIVNSGVLEASGSGGLVIESAIENSGLLWAKDANLTVHGPVSGGGTAIIDGHGTLDLEGQSTVDVAFGADGAGTLIVGDSFHFHGTISGYGEDDIIDLTDFGSAEITLDYHENDAGTGGTLTVSDGEHAAELEFAGHYTIDDFSVANDPTAGARIAYMQHALV